MSKMYKLMSLKGYNGPEDVIKLQEWLAIEKQIFIETRVCWNKKKELSLLDIVQELGCLRIHYIQ